jgi:hypothetical protein
MFEGSSPVVNSGVNSALKTFVTAAARIGREKIAKSVIFVG